MTFTHALATNNYGPQKFIVSTSAANGTHTTLATAMAAASSGDTIYLRDSVTENVTITPGVNITSLGGTSLNVPSITGTLTMTGAGTSSLTGLRLVTNSAFLIAVTGSAASILNVKNCYLAATNNTAISFTSSSGSALIYLDECDGDLSTTGIALIACSSAGTVRTNACFFLNSGASSTANTFSAGSFFPVSSAFANPFSFSGTTSVMSAFEISINTSATNSTALTVTSTLAGGSALYRSGVFSGSASAISVGAGALLLCDFLTAQSTNTNPITGAGTIVYGSIINLNTTLTGVINTTTQTPIRAYNGVSTSSLQPAFLATHTVAQNNVTGNSALVTYNFTTEIFDQGANYNATSTFTAPYTGRYQFNSSIGINDAATSTQGFSFLITSNRNYNGSYGPPAPLGAGTQYFLVVTALTDMDTGDTAIIQALVAGMVGNTADFPTTDGSFFSGYLVC